MDGRINQSKGGFFVIFLSLCFCDDRINRFQKKKKGNERGNETEKKTNQFLTEGIALETRTRRKNVLKDKDDPLMRCLMDTRFRSLS